MFDFLLLLLLGAILLFVFSSSVRQWVLIKFLQSVQKRVQKNMEEQFRQQAGSQRGYQSGADSRSYEQESHSQGKMDIDDIAIKKFSKPHQEDYVDFEEIPK